MTATCTISDNQPMDGTATMNSIRQSGWKEDFQLNEPAPTTKTEAFVLKIGVTRK